MAILLTAVCFVLMLGVAYELVGWVLAFLVVSQSALVSFVALIVLACVAMAIVSHGSNSNRWWGGMIVGICVAVGIQMLEPYVEIVRVVLAVAAATWATIIIYRSLIRRIVRNTTHHTP